MTWPICKHLPYILKACFHCLNIGVSDIQTYEDMIFFCQESFQTKGATQQYLIVFVYVVHASIYALVEISFS